MQTRPMCSGRLPPASASHHHTHPSLSHPPPSPPASYYLNNFEDGHKQDALDLVTGGYAVVPGEWAGGGLCCGAR